VFHVILDAAGGVAKEFVVLDDTVTAADKKASPVLTVWRRLHVEVDSMGAPPQGTIFAADDAPVNDVPEPDTGLIVSAFAPAYILPVFDTGNNNGDAPFVYNITDAQLDGQGQTNRATAESADYWVAYIQGAYEGDVGDDNDPDDENAIDGETTPAEPEYSFIYIEVIRDLTIDEHPTWNRTLVEQRTVVHEIGHQFGLPHAHGGVMHASTDPHLRTSDFTDQSIAAIRDIISP
jgi:hypothetical protein